MWPDRKSTRLNSSHGSISYAVFCLKKKKKLENTNTDNAAPLRYRDTVLVTHTYPLSSHPAASLSHLSAEVWVFLCFFFFFNYPAPPEIYPLPLPAPLPI